MPLASMTGFARTDGSYGPYLWGWEVKSVNGKGLDIRCRLPGGFDSLEHKIRALLSRSFRRGNFQVTLHLRRQADSGDVQINDSALQTVLSLVRELNERAELAPTSAGDILGLRGVLDLCEVIETPEERAARDAALMSGLEQAVADLADMRRQEGARLKDVIAAVFADISRLAAAARASAAAQPETLRARLKAQVEELLAAAPSLPEDRLAQEVAILITRSDIREEIDRLEAHISAAGDLLHSEQPVGRRLDFLMQELNREANTLCSKASDVALTRIGLDLKAAIDQAREQVQNIE